MTTLEKSDIDPAGADGQPGLRDPAEIVVPLSNSVKVIFGKDTPVGEIQDLMQRTRPPSNRPYRRATDSIVPMGYPAETRYNPTDGLPTPVRVLPLQVAISEVVDLADVPVGAEIVSDYKIN